MSDDLSKRAPQDASRISLQEPWEVRYWTSKFGVTRDALMNAVKAVGNGAKSVGEYLKNKK